MARATTMAEHYRAMRESFELALELGCTPKEAARRLAAERAAEADRAATRCLQAKMATPLPLISQASEPDDRREPWMMRD